MSRSRVCAERSPAPGPLGCYFYCTRDRGHAGEHVAQSIDDEIVGRWGGKRPASLEEAMASEPRR
jgi:hypothetical protein